MVGGEVKHSIPLGTRVSFENNPKIYFVDSYNTLIGPCSSDCPYDHDCYDESYMCVREESWTAFPLSNLKHIFDDPIHHIGRIPTLAEKLPIVEE